MIIIHLNSLRAAERFIKTFSKMRKLNSAHPRTAIMILLVTKKKCVDLFQDSLTGLISFNVESDCGQCTSNSHPAELSSPSLRFTLVSYVDIKTEHLH